MFSLKNTFDFQNFRACGGLQRHFFFKKYFSFSKFSRLRRAKLTEAHLTSKTVLIFKIFAPAAGYRNTIGHVWFFSPPQAKKWSVFSPQQAKKWDVFSCNPQIFRPFETYGLPLAPDLANSHQTFFLNSGSAATFRILPGPPLYSGTQCYSGGRIHRTSVWRAFEKSLVHKKL